MWSGRGDRRVEMASLAEAEGKAAVLMGQEGVVHHRVGVYGHLGRPGQRDGSAGIDFAG